MPDDGTARASETAEGRARLRSWGVACLAAAILSVGAWLLFRGPGFGPAPGPSDAYLKTLANLAGMLDADSRQHQAQGWRAIQARRYADALEQYGHWVERRADSPYFRLGLRGHPLMLRAALTDATLQAVAEQDIALGSLAYAHWLGGSDHEAESLLGAPPSTEVFLLTDTRDWNREGQRREALVQLATEHAEFFLARKDWKRAIQVSRFALEERLKLNGGRYDSAAAQLHYNQAAAEYNSGRVGTAHRLFADLRRRLPNYQKARVNHLIRGSSRELRRRDAEKRFRVAVMQMQKTQYVKARDTLLELRREHLGYKPDQVNDLLLKAEVYDALGTPAAAPARAELQPEIYADLDESGDLPDVTDDGGHWVVPLLPGQKPYRNDVPIATNSGLVGVRPFNRPDIDVATPPPIR